MIKNWKLEITENETKLIIQDGAAMNNDILSLARHLVIKYHLNKLPVYHENGNKYFDYTLKEDTKYKNDILIGTKKKAIKLDDIYTKIDV